MINVGVFTMIEKIFGCVLQGHRKEKGYSQEKLALICQLDRTYISLLERGLRSPSIRTIFLIANALNINPSQLVKEIELTIQETLESN